MSNLIHRPLTGVDLTKLLGSNLAIITYDELQDVKSIDDLFDNEGRCLLLYLIQSRNEGHWTCLHRADPTHIEFFDSLGTPAGGGKPDSQLNWVPASERANYGEDFPYLLRLLRKSGATVVYNRAALQSADPAIATCGRHCVVRLWCRDAPLHAYVPWLQSQAGSPDQYVTAVTAERLGR